MTRLSLWEQQIGGVLTGMRLDSLKNKIVALAGQHATRHRTAAVKHNESRSRFIRFSIGQSGWCGWSPQERSYRCEDTLQGAGIWEVQRVY